jgi:hypothetical protein
MIPSLKVRSIQFTTSLSVPLTSTLYCISIYISYDVFSLKVNLQNRRERGHWRDPDIDGRIILRWIFKKLEWVVGTG